MKIYNLVFLLLLPFYFVCDMAIEFPASPPIVDSPQQLNSKKSGLANIVFKSTDGGQTWQDISEGLPENLQVDGLQRDGFFANESGLYLRAENGIYHNKANSTAPLFLKQQDNIVPSKTGVFACTEDGQFLRRINGSSVWSPMYPNFQGKEVNSIIETADGTVFVACSNGLFKSKNSGKTWKQVHTGDWAMKIVASNGVLLATNQRGILRSTDSGENWDLVISEGGVGIEVECIDGGFAAITYNSTSETRRMRTSYDGGKTWQAIDAGLPPSLSIASIVQVGEYFFCGHPKGIFRSSDEGKTWKLLLPSIANKVFNLSIAGKVIYAIPRNGGC